MAQIGILIPRSSIYGSMNFDFIDGLKTSLANMGVKGVDIATAGIGIGGSDKDIYSACEKMLLDGVEVIAGYINPTSAEMIQPMFENANAVFILLDAGYQFPRPGYKQTNSFTLSLEGALACKVLPQIAAQKGDTSFAYTCSFFDSGFRAAFGFFQGVADAGSAITFNHVTQLKRADFTLEPLTNHLKENPAVAVMGAFCGDMAQDLFGGMEAEEEYSRHNLYGAPFTIEETWLAKSPYPGAPVTGVVPWASGLKNPENEAFVAAMAKRNRTANYFSLLAWEAGQLIAKALEADNATERIALLESYSFTSPRGTITIDKETHTSLAPLYVATAVENEANGMCLLVPGHEVNANDVSSQRAKLWQEIAAFQGGFTSWFNAYACLD